MMACNELGVAPIMWAPYRRYLEEKLSPSLGSNLVKAQVAGNRFFEVAFPAYSPTTVRAFAKLRSDRRIKTLRAEILRASEVLPLERNAARMRRMAGWIATTVGEIPVPGLGLAAAWVAEAITNRMERKQREHCHWFYLISDGRGAT